MVQTVVKDVYEPEVIEYGSGGLGGSDKVEIVLYGLNGGESYEDRDVYISLKKFSTFCVSESIKFSGDTIEDNPVEVDLKGELPSVEEFSESALSEVDPKLGIEGEVEFYLRGEEAIELGTKLIQHGRKALMSNMINHQLYREYTRYHQWLKDDIIKTTTLTVVDHSPRNYGSGYRTYKLTVEFKEGKDPNYSEDFSLERVLYFSPFIDEYKKALSNYIHNDSTLIIVGYDRDRDLNNFEQACKMSNPTLDDLPIEPAKIDLSLILSYTKEDLPYDFKYGFST
jgi:hypothetical protein